MNYLTREQIVEQYVKNSLVRKEGFVLLKNYKATSISSLLCLLMFLGYFMMFFSLNLVSQHAYQGES